jgi:hypothetical protein
MCGGAGRHSRGIDAQCGGEVSRELRNDSGVVGVQRSDDVVHAGGH